MSGPLNETAKFDGAVQDETGQAILVVLNACRWADFRYLQAATGLSKDKLSVRLRELTAHGLIAMKERPATWFRTPRTEVSLTKQGKTAIRGLVA